MIADKSLAQKMIKGQIERIALSTYEGENSDSLTRIFNFTSMQRNAPQLFSENLTSGS